jgi:hypothetical protein
VLRIEDMKVIGGKDIRELSFTKRWEQLLEFYRNSYVFDSTLQRGLLIEPAVYKPIDSIQSWVTIPDYIFAQNDTMPRRLRIQLTEKGLDFSKNLLVEPGQNARGPPVQPRPTIQSKPTVQAKPTIQSKPTVQAKPTQVQKKPPVKTIAIPEDFPDTYTIVINGEKRGYAAVQDIELSRKLRNAAKESKEIPVKVEWNQEFTSYEILSLV